MNIAFITKYPPIHGGTSSQAYWLIKALAKKHKIHVVTNAWEVESKYRLDITSSDIDKYRPKNVNIYSTNPFDMPKHIPFSPEYLAKLSSLSTDVIREYNCDLIDSWYMLPYVLAGSISKSFTKKPLIMRHAGSDMSRLLESPFLNTFFKEVFIRADKIITHRIGAEKFMCYGINKKKLFIQSFSGIDLEAFNPKVQPINLYDYGVKTEKNVPIIGYINKIEQSKGVFELVDAVSRIKKDFRLLFVTPSQNRDHLIQKLKQRKLLNKSIIIDPVAPWKVPAIIKACSFVVSAEHDFPIPEHNPRIPREVMATGVCSLISKDLCVKKPYSNIKNMQHAVVFDPRDIKNFSEKLSSLISNPDIVSKIGRSARKFSEKHEFFDNYILENIEVYKEALNE